MKILVDSIKISIKKMNFNQKIDKNRKFNQIFNHKKVLKVLKKVKKLRSHKVNNIAILLKM